MHEAKAEGGIVPGLGKDMRDAMPVANDLDRLRQVRDLDLALDLRQGPAQPDISTGNNQHDGRDHGDQSAQDPLHSRSIPTRPALTDAIRSVKASAGFGSGRSGVEHLLDRFRR